MEMDSDPIDQNLLLQFTCLGTTDRDDLVKQFRELIDKVNDSTASFYLEMNNWNLQNAICSFLDYHSPRHNLSMVVEEQSQLPWVQPNASFSMWWTIRNDGLDSWPRGCTFRGTGVNFSFPSAQLIPLPIVEPGCCTTVLAHLTAPSVAGQYTSSWQIMTPSGHYFGEVLKLVFQVNLKLEDQEEEKLSEELAARMALIDHTDCKRMEEEASSESFEGSTVVSNPIEIDRLDITDFNQGDNNIS